MNPNYTRINAKEALEDENSVFYYYQKLIRLRKENPVFVNGKFELLLPEDERFSPIREQMSIQRCWYVQTLRMRKLAAHCLMSGKPGKSGFRNYEDDREGNILRPYEAVIIGVTGK